MMRERGSRRAAGGASGGRRCLAALVLFAAAASPALAQRVSVKGFLETTVIGFPQPSPKETAGVINEYLGRYEITVRAAPWLRLAGSLEARADSFMQTDYAWTLDWFDRKLRRSALGMRRFDATVSKGPLTLQIGKQNVRWGKTDILTPTDRFAPRDMLGVFDTDFQGVTAARLTVGLQTNILDIVWVPVFTPSRLPLLDHRWAVTPESARGVAIRDLGARYPHGSQLGARWNHVGEGYEFSVSGFSGFNTLPRLDAQINFLESGIDLTRVYPRIWMAGADAAVPLSMLTLKGEAAFFGSSDQRTDQYVQYVVQLERQSGEWFFVGGYAGEIVTTSRTSDRFAPERGLDQLVSRPRGVHDRHQPQPGIRRRHSPKRPRDMGAVRVLAGEGTARAAHRARDDHHRKRRRFHRPVPAQLESDADGEVQLLGN